MALGTQKGSNRDVIFVDLKFAVSKGEEAVGFRQTINRIPRENAKEGERKYDYEYKMHNYVEGEITNFRVREEPRFDNPKEKEFMAIVTVHDLHGDPDVVVKYPLLSQAGRRLTGLVAAAVEANAGSVHIYTNYAEAGTKIGDRVLEKPQAYINAKVGDVHGQKLTPLYYGEDGKPMLDENGKPQPLPMGQKVVIGRKEVWDFSAADTIVSQTALVLVDHFQREHQRQSEAVEQSDESHEQAHEYDPGHPADDYNDYDEYAAMQPR
ncbi:MAG: hypothetical protein P3W87_003930 [Gammaproteobacteria bacterium]|nr:hypothetical protein [Gammaproteobacteria bacterium]